MTIGSIASRTARALFVPTALTLALAPALTAQTPPAPPAPDPTVVFRGARILPGNGPAIEDGVLVIAGGKVQAIGPASLPIPQGAQIVDAKDRVITPGLVDAGAQAGLGVRDQNEQTDEVTPHMRVLDALDPADKRLRQMRARGVTTVHVSPGNRNVIGGLGAVLKTAGETIAEMLIKDEVMLRVTLGSEPSQGNKLLRGGPQTGIFVRRPFTRMGVVFALRKAFYDAKDYLELSKQGNAPTNPGFEVLARALRKELPVVTTARAEQDIRTALRIAEEFGYLAVLDEAQEIHKCVQTVADANVKVLIGAPSLPRAQGAAATDGATTSWATLGLLTQYRVPFAITTGSTNTPGGGGRGGGGGGGDGGPAAAPAAPTGALDLIGEATFAVRFGLAPEHALDAITRVPAEILGVADRVGSLAAGKDADFVIWNGNPFDPATAVTAVYVNGREVTR